MPDSAILWSPPSSSVHGDSPDKNTGVGCHVLPQEIFPTQGLNPGLPHCRQILYHLSHQGNLWILEWAAYPFSRRSSGSRDGTRISCTAGGFFTSRVTKDALQRSTGPKLRSRSNVFSVLAFSLIQQTSRNRRAGHPRNLCERWVSESRQPSQRKMTCSVMSGQCGCFLGTAGHSGSLYFL